MMVKSLAGYRQGDENTDGVLWLFTWTEQSLLHLEDCRKSVRLERVRGGGRRERASILSTLWYQT